MYLMLVVIEEGEKVIKKLERKGIGRMSDIKEIVSKKLKVGVVC